MRRNKLVRSSEFVVRSLKILHRTPNTEHRTGFTLLEVLLGFAIFAVIMTLVLVTVAGSFNSLRKAGVFMLKEQKQRLCLYYLGREVSSFTRINFPQMRFEGENNGFFLSMPGRTA